MSRACRGSIRTQRSNRFRNDGDEAGGVTVELFGVVIQAVLQGLTEFLPVSSSGHLVLTQHFLGVGGESALLLSVVLHLGTLLSVVMVYHRTVWELIREAVRFLRDLFGGKLRFKEMSESRRLLMMLVAATAPLLLFYFLKDPIKRVSSDDSILFEGFCFLYTGVLLALSDRLGKREKGVGQIKAADALTVGFLQGTALLPGVSRSGSTIAGGLFRGFRRETAVRFSFLLSIPPILAGSLTEFLDCREAGEQVDPGLLVVGFLVATAVGFLSIRLVNRLIRDDRFRVFSYYLLALGTIVIVIGIVEAANGGINIIRLLSR